MNKGTATAVDTDFDGDARPSGGGIEVGADEYAGPSPLNDNALFVELLYRDVLGRTGDAGGIQFWAGQIDSAVMSRAEVAAFFFGTAEYTGKVPPVVRLYLAAFQRIPDYGGLLYWTNVFAQGIPLAGIADFFVNSPEFQATYGALSNGEFVTLLYQNVLGRGPDPDGLAFWTGQLDSGLMVRGDVLVGFSESAEFQAASAHQVYVVGVYAGLLLRVPDPSGLDAWVNYLDGGNSETGFIEAVLASGEYAARF